MPSAWPAAASFAGTGALSVSEAPRPAPRAAFAGTGTLSAWVITREVARAAFAGAGDLSFSQAGSAEFDGAGNFGTVAVNLTPSPLLPPRPSPPSTADRHIRRSGDDYAAALLQLLPRGQAWPRDPGTILVKAITGLAEYFGRVDARAADLLEQESDPRKTIELLPDWERNWGLPDPCFQDTLTIADRQRMLVFKMTLLGGQSRYFFIHDVALGMLGITVTITEYAPFMAGISQAGDTRTPPLDPNPLHGDYRWYIGPPEMRYYWTVHISTTRLIWFRCASGQAGVDPHLRIGREQDLECLFNRWKPSHTEIVYDYSGEAGFDDPMAGTP